MNQDYLYIISRKIKKLHLAIFAVVIFLVATLGYTSDKGTIKIIGLPDDGNTVIELFDENGRIVEEVTANTEYVKTVKKGIYSIVLYGLNTSQVSTIAVDGFLSTTTLTASPQEEENRVFIADNPGDCVTDAFQNVLSYQCSGSLSSVVYHVPASQTLPTYTNTLRDSVTGLKITDSYGSIETIIEKDGQILALVFVTDDYGTFHRVYNITLSNNIPVATYLYEINGLGDERLTAKSDTSGSVLLTGESTGTVYVGKDFRSLEKIDTPPIDELQQFSVSLGNERYFAALKKNANATSEFEIVGASNTIITISNDGSAKKELKTKNSILSLQSCGDSICVLDEKNILSIYDPTLAKIGFIHDVKSYSASEDGTLWCLTSRGTIRYDIPYATGYLAYSNDALPPTEISHYKGSTFITVESKSNSHLLRIGSGDYIDEVVGLLIENQFVKAISINNKMMFVSPELGERIIDDQGKYKFNPSMQKFVKENIESFIQENNEQFSGYNIRLLNL
jgi:hypothetical protein